MKSAKINQGGRRRKVLNFFAIESRILCVCVASVRLFTAEIILSKYRLLLFNLGC